MFRIFTDGSVMLGASISETGWIFTQTEKARMFIAFVLLHREAIVNQLLLVYNYST